MVRRPTKRSSLGTRYFALDGTGRMFRIVALPEDEPAGSIGFWDREWQGATV